MAVDPIGVVYVHSSHLLKYDALGNLLDEFSVVPTGVIAVDPQGQYLYSAGGPGVGKYTLNGTRVGGWTTVDHSLTNNSGIAVGPGGDVYVSETLTDGVYRYSGDGVFISAWGKAGGRELQNPAGLAVDDHGNVFVCDRSNARVVKFTADGVFLTEWGTGGSGDGEFSGVIDVAVDGDGNIYTVENLNHRVQKFGYPPTPVRSTTWGRLKALYREPTRSLR